MQLQPREFFTIVRQIDDHLDTNTYFVQVVIRNARTDAIIETLALTDQGEQRFSVVWQVVADTSGDGFYVLITSDVYTDEAFTTKSERYGTEMREHLIEERRRNVGGGGGVDDVAVRKIMREELVRVEKEPLKIEDRTPDVLKGLNVLAQKIDDIDIPQIPSFEKIEQKETDLTPVLQAISDIRIPEQKEVDLQNVIGSINQLSEIIGTFNIAGVEKNVTGLSKAIVEVNLSLTNLVKKVEKLEGAQPEEKKNLPVRSPFPLRKSSLERERGAERSFRRFRHQ